MAKFAGFFQWSANKKSTKIHPVKNIDTIKDAKKDGTGKANWENNIVDHTERPLDRQMLLECSSSTAMLSLWYFIIRQSKRVLQMYGDVVVPVFWHFSKETILLCCVHPTILAVHDLRAIYSVYSLSGKASPAQHKTYIPKNPTKTLTRKCLPHAVLLH